MKVQWKKLLTRTAIWLAAEILLNVLGIDDLADYSEFIFERHEAADFVNLDQSPQIHFPAYSIE